MKSDSKPGPTLSPPCDEQSPEHCKHCGRAMYSYGNLNGVIGWHLNMYGANTDTGDVCSICRAKELRGELKSH